MPLFTVLIMLVNGFSTVFFPYQSAPIPVGLRLGDVGLAESTRVTLVLFTLTVLTLLPLSFPWWRWLGSFNGGALRRWGVLAPVPP